MAGEHQSSVYGEFATDYRASRLAELCEPEAGIQTGPFGSQLHQEDYVEAGTPIITVEHLGENRIVRSDIPCVRDSDRERLSKYALRKGDIVFSRVGSVDRRALVRDEEDGWLFSGRCLRIRPDQTQIDPRYLSYFLGLSAFREHIRAIAVGATMPSLNTQLLSDVIVYYPKMAEQRAIAHILGTLDDKIEMNRRMNDTLESMARTLFKSWFVDFNPVRYKAEGRDTGLPKPIADLVPDRLVDSELGEIPEGWEVGTLAEHYDAVKGVSYKGSGLADAGTPLHNLNSVYEGGGYKYEGIKYYTGEYADRHVVRPGDVIVTNTEQGHDRLLIGFAAMVPRIFGEHGIPSHHIYRMRPIRTTTLTSAFLYHLLNSAQMHEIVSRYANGTTVNMLPIDGVQKPEIVVPSSKVVQAFDDLAMKGELRKEALVVESRTLAALRDTLLPKLISGELWIPDAERIMRGTAV